jgi:hypothetical protein
MHVVMCLDVFNIFFMLMLAAILDRTVQLLFEVVQPQLDKQLLLQIFPMTTTGDIKRIWA